MNVAGILIATALRLGESTAVKLDDAALSYRALDAASARVAALLRGRGVAPGDRVGVMLPNVPELAVVYYGILRAGGVVVPLNVLLEEREVAFCLSDSGTRLLLAWHALAEVVEVGAGKAETDCLFVTPGEFGWLLGGVRPDRDLRERDAADTAVILSAPASAPVAPPESAELTHAGLRREADGAVRAHALVSDDVVLSTLPLADCCGQAWPLNATIRAGGCLTLVERFDAGKALEVIARDGATVLHGAPTAYAALLDHPDRVEYDLSTLRICVSVGAPMPAGTLRGLEQAFGCRVVEER